MSKKQSNKKVISLRLTEEENQKLKYCADLCGLSQNEFIRQLCKGQTPKAKPTREFWKLLNTLYSVHKGFKECAEFEPSALEICKEIECLILDLQEVNTGTPQSLLCGEKEHPRNGEPFDTCGESDEWSVM